MPIYSTLDYDSGLFTKKIIENTFSNPFDKEEEDGKERERSYRKTTMQILALQKQLESPLPFPTEYDKRNYEDNKKDSLLTIKELFFRNKIISNLVQTENIYSKIVETDLGKDFLEKLGALDKEILEPLDIDPSYEIGDVDFETLSDEKAAAIINLYLKYFAP